MSRPLLPGPQTDGDAARQFVASMLEGARLSSPNLKTYKPLANKSEAEQAELFKGNGFQIQRIGGRDVGNAFKIRADVTMLDLGESLTHRLRCLDALLIHAVGNESIAPVALALLEAAHVMAQEAVGFHAVMCEGMQRFVAEHQTNGGAA